MLSQNSQISHHPVFFYFSAPTPQTYGYDVIKRAKFDHVRTKHTYVDATPFKTSGRVTSVEIYSLYGSIKRIGIFKPASDTPCHMEIVTKIWVRTNSRGYNKVSHMHSFINVVQIMH